MFALIAALYWASSRVLLGGFKNVEDKNATTTIGRVQSGVQSLVEELDTITTDYAHWDATYQFVVDRNAEYIKETLNNSTIEDLRINFLVYADNAGRVIWGTSYDKQRGLLPLPADLTAQITNKNLLVPTNNTKGMKKGLLMLADGPMLFVARPILRSDKSGPVRGTFIEGRTLDSAKLKWLEQFSAPLSLYAFNRNDLPDDFKNAKTHLAHEAHFIEPLNDTLLSSYILLKDWQDKPAVILRADLPRDVFLEGRHSRSMMLGLLIIISIGIVFMAATLMEKLVMSRLIQLSESVGDISQRGDAAARVPLLKSILGHDKDELTQLGGNINVMLQALEEANERQRFGDELFRQMTLNATDALYVAYPAENRVQWYGQIDTMLGFAAGGFERTMDAWRLCIYADDLEKIEDARQRCLAAADDTEQASKEIKPCFDLEYRVCRADGTLRHWIDRGKMLWQPESPGAPARAVLIGACTDITEFKRAGDELEQSLSLLQATLESTAEGILVMDAQGGVVNFNRQMTHMWRFPEDVLQKRERRALVDFVSEQFEDRQAFLERALELRQRIDEEFFDVLRLKDGRIFERTAKPQRLGERVVGTVLSFRDVTAREQAAQALSDSQVRLSGVVETSVDAIFIVARDGRITFVNVAGERMLGMSREVITKSNYNREVLCFLDDNGEPLPNQNLPVERALQSCQAVHDVDCCLETAIGRRLWLSVNASPLMSDIDQASGQIRGEVTGVVLTVSDVTLQKALEERLAHQAFHDPLTGLPNRALFLDRLDVALSRTVRQNLAVGVLFIDLDNFKFINDSLGHSSGDQLLMAVADRLQIALRAGDTASRFGGDEFTILLDNLADINQAIQVAERILEALRAPLPLTAREVTVTPSIGIAVGTRAAKVPFEGVLEDSARAGAQAEELLRNADAAMYEAKRKGRARYEIFQATMSVAALKRLNLENDMRRAIERNELVAFYQPKVVLETGDVIGMEALIRWNHPERGLVPPLDFIPLAEETGLIVPLGWWMFEEVCRQTQLWQEQFADHPAHKFMLSKGHDSSALFPLIAINISARQLHEPGLLDQVSRLLKLTSLNPHSVVLEITEHVVMEETEATVSRLHALKKLGVRLAIDDFGTGYSSMSYLHSFPLDFLKIDRRFVAGLGQEGSNSVIVSSMVELAHNLGLTVIAEGVEIERERQRLCQMGCALAQGYFFARPMPASEMTKYLQAKLDEQAARHRNNNSA